MKVGLIGLGHWGKNHARVLGNFKSEGEIEELYFFDIDKNQLERMSKFHNAAPIESIEDMSRLDLDAVDIVVPANLHFKVAKHFVETGVKTFIEKPFTDKEEDALKLIDMATNPESDIMVGHIFRFHSAVKKAKDLIKSGQIGKPLVADIRRTAYGVPRKDNGVVFSLAIHDLDLFGYLVGLDKPKSVEAISSKIVGPTEDHAFIKVEYHDSEFIGIAEESWMHPHQEKSRTCAVQGTNGVVSLDFLKPAEILLHSKYIDFDRRLVDNGTFTQTLPFKEPLTEEIRHFLMNSRENKPFEAGPEVGLNAVRLCNSAIESANTGRPVDLLKHDLS